MVLGVCRPTPPVDVDRLTQAQDRRVCALVESFLDVALVGISAPSDPSPEDFAATVRINDALSRMGETLRQSAREMGC